VKKEDAMKKVAAKRALLIKKCNKTKNKSQTSIIEFQFQVEEEILDLNVTLSSNLTTLEKILLCFLSDS
jgi:hypothetical protein